MSCCKGCPHKMGPEADIADARTTLTPREIGYVRFTWALAKDSNNLNYHGGKFLAALFMAHPHMQEKFKNLRGKKFDDVRDGRDIQKYGAAMLAGFDKYITFLDDAYLKQMGREHNERTVSLQDYKYLNIVLVKYLREYLGVSQMCDGAKCAWVHFLDVMFSVLSTVY